MRDQKLRKSYFASRRKEIRDKVYQAYGGWICKCCGEKEPSFLQLDHIYGGGTKEKRKFGNLYVLWNWLIKNNFPHGYQVLCANCNWSKRNSGVCVHQELLLKNSVNPS